MKRRPIDTADGLDKGMAKSANRKISHRQVRRRLGLEPLECRRLMVGDIFVKVSDDPNANGVGDLGEDRLPGWTVYLDTNQNSLLDVGEPSLVTDGRGEALFTGLAEANFRVGEIVQPGWTPTSPEFVTARVRDGRQENVDFFNFHPQIGNIDGTIWNDLDGNGVRAVDPSTGAFVEPGTPGRTVFLDLNRDGALTAGEPSTVTDGLGEYRFVGVASGSYALTEVLPSGWEPTTGFNVARNILVRTDQTTHVDFGNFLTQPVTVAGTVWNDLNGNGIRDVDGTSHAFTEPGIADWQVFVDANGDGLLTAGEPSATTDADGHYLIGNASHGTFTIREVVSLDWTPTAPISGARSLSLLNGQVVNGVDFGNRQRQESTLRGTVFFDANHSSTRDAGERGLPGITVFLDLNHNGVIDPAEPQTVTSSDLFFTPGIDEAGTYSFTHLGAGAYDVREIVPAELSSTVAEQRVHSVSVATAQVLAGVDFANVYRPNEIHGIAFNDANRNHRQDPDEPGLAGVTMFIDRNRDNAWQPDEPSTVSGADGSYAFTNLSPGAYIIRQIRPDAYEQTYPTTIGGTLWPTGVSNPASGNVSPSNITASLAEGQSHRETVSLTLPGSGGLTNLVDVFLLFDDTGSFTGNSPIVRAAFPEIISALQAALPDVDLGFGVGRFEEYGSYASELASGRPFVLNQPIVASATPGFSTSIQAALNRTAPGFGGDTPETLIEALYQTVTGLGFDGNNNGTVSDSGAAGLASTQITPGPSGDVPSFASFMADPTDAVMAPAGNLGGAGFRPGALPIILAATDTGFAYQPKGETSITGTNGVTLPLSQLTQASRPTTPFSSGAGIQETITGLNALGALVVGLGTNAVSTADPRQDLEAISKLTGATNQSTATIANGTADPIAPGDPLYFQIASGFGSTVAAGVVNAIQNAATNVALNITLRASDPRVQIINHTGTINGVGAGQTATFDVEFVSDGRPHRFDLQFVREGTNVVLGSIPVVLGTPVPGDGYEYDELEDGEIHHSSQFGDTLFVPATVIDRQLFYNQSSFDGNSASVNANDDLAIATDKQAYLSGSGVATFTNISSYSRGINGLMIDLDGGGAHHAINVEDFSFKVGQDNAPGAWNVAPAPSAVVVRPGAGSGGSDRVEITWASGAIRNEWLEVQVLATSHTGLAATDVFYWGSRVGDTGAGTPATTFVTSGADKTAVLSGLGSGASILNPRDFNHDGNVTAADGTIAINSLGNLIRLQLGSAAPLASTDSGVNAVVASALAATATMAPSSERVTQSDPPLRLDLVERHKVHAAALLEYTDVSGVHSGRRVRSKANDLADDALIDDELIQAIAGLLDRDYVF